MTELEAGYTISPELLTGLKLSGQITRSPTLLKSRNRWDCLICCFGTLFGQTYETMLQAVGRNVTEDDYLSGRGYTLQEVYVAGLQFRFSCMPLNGVNPKLYKDYPMVIVGETWNGRSHAVYGVGGMYFDNGRESSKLAGLFFQVDGIVLVHRVVQHERTPSPSPT